MDGNIIGNITISRNGERPVALRFAGGDLTAACIQASIDTVVGPGVVHVVTDEDRATRAAEAKRTPATYDATKDRAGWVEASWATVGVGGDPSRERRFHALGCRWEPANRRWACADGCNVPGWNEEEANADE